MVSRILDNAEGIISRIREQTGLSEDEVLSKIHAKQEEYGGLLTEAGAAYSLAKEAGIAFAEDAAEKTATPLNELSEGMMDVHVRAVAEAVSPLREFDKNGRQGSVFNIMLRDETGSANLAVWNKPELNKEISPGRRVSVKNAYTKMRLGVPELNLGNLGSISVDAEAGAAAPSSERASIASLKPGEGKRIRAVIVELYPPTIISVCKNCGKMVEGGACDKCGGDGRKTAIVNAELDDGTEVIRGVFYRDAAEGLLGATGEQLFQDKALFNLKKRTILGEEKLFYGEVRDSRDRIEFVVRGFEDFDVAAELKAK